MGSLTHVERLFVEVRSLPPEQRAAFLRTHCADDTAMRNDVISLLAHADAADDGFLDPAELKADPEAVREALSELESDLNSDGAGRYTLGAELGRGGSGVVHRARQTHPLTRDVAMKILHIGLDRSRVRARFDVECAALSLMDHPNIAKILDAGFTRNGRPFLVMEHIVGKPITDHCNEAGLDVEGRLELFTQACDAIQSAHQKGVIHRDLKPSNIMVTMIDDRPCVKVIDFSIAKTTTNSDTISRLSRMTRHGEVLGSLPYMAPEQLGCEGARSADGVADAPTTEHAAKPAADDVDTRADVYALGAVLYELLTQSPPLRLDLSGIGSIEGLRAARENMAIDSPSARVRMQIERDREAGGRDDRKRLARRLRGELDWITLRALEFPRARRYATVQTFGDDVRTHLRDEPISAGPPSAAYRTRKFIARNRNWVVAAMFGFLLLLTGFVGVTWQAYIATQARRGELSKAYMAAIAGADLAVSLRDGISARRMLDAAPDARRGWEWNYLAQKAKQCLWSRTLDRSALTLRLSNDGQRLAAGDEAGRVLLCDAATGNLIITLDGATAGIMALDVSDDGRFVAAGDMKGDVHVWNTESGDVVNSVKMVGTARTSITSVAFSASGKQLVVVAFDGTITLRDVLSETPTRSWPAEALSAEFIDGDRRIVSNGVTGVSVWKVEDGSFDIALLGPDLRAMRLAITPDRSAFAASDDRQTLHIWSSASLKERATLFVPGDLTALVLNADASIVGLASRDGRIECWDAGKGEIVGTYLGPQDATSAVALSPDALRVFAAARDQSLWAWGRTINADENVIWRGGQIAGAAFDEIGATAVVCGGADVQHIRFATHAASPAATLIAREQQRASTVAITPSGSIAVIGHDKIVRFWSSQTDTLRDAQQPTDEPINAVCVNSADTLAASAAGNTLQTWDPATGALLHTSDASLKRPTALLCTPDGEVIAADGDRRVIVWNPQTNQLRTLATEDHIINALALSHDGLMLAIGQEEGVVSLRSPKDGASRGELKSGAAAVHALAFSTDDARLFIGTAIGGIQVWRLDSPELLLYLRGHRGPIKQLVATSNGLVFSASYDGTLRKWDGRPPSLMGALKAKAPTPTTASFAHTTAPTTDPRAAAAATGP